MPRTTTQSSSESTLPSMPLGRPRAPGTEVERIEARRAQVRKNVQAFRQRQKEKKLVQAAAKAAHRGEGGDGRVGGVICRDELLDGLSTTSESTSISARSSPGRGGAGGGFVYQLMDQDDGDPDSWMWRLPQDLAGNEGYQNTFTSIIHKKDHWWSDEENGDHLEPISSFEPFCDLAGCGSTWFHGVMMETVDPGLGIINDAYLASALAIISRERQDNVVSVAASCIQSRSLRRLRQSLHQWTENPQLLCPISLSMAALSCAMSELVVNLSWANFAGHLSGVGSLLSYHDPASLSTQAARELFYGYRSLEAAFAFFHGRTLFLADPRWIDLPWKCDIVMSQHPLHKMLDIAFRLLPELGTSQPQPQPELGESVIPPHSPPIGLWHTKSFQQRQKQCDGQEHRQRQQRDERQRARDRLSRLRLIATDLDFWEAEFRNQQTHLGGLHHKKEAEWTGLYDFAFEFTSLPSATAYTFYAGIRIRLVEAMYAALCVSNENVDGIDYFTGRDGADLNSAMTDELRALIKSKGPCSPPGALLRPSSPRSVLQTEKTEMLLQGLRWLRQALQSLEFFHTGVTKVCGWMATLFAFDAAWRFLNSDTGARELELSGNVQLAAERQWCGETAVRFEVMGVPLLARR